MKKFLSFVLVSSFISAGVFAAESATPASLQRLFKNATTLKDGDIKLEVPLACTTYSFSKGGLKVKHEGDAINLVSKTDSDYYMNMGKNADFIGFRVHSHGYLGMNPISPYFVYLKKLSPGVLIGELAVNADHGSLDRDEVLPSWPKAVSAEYINDEHQRDFRALGYQVCF